MEAIADNRVKFYKPNPKIIEKRVNSGGHIKESRTHKCQLIKVADARNTQITDSELRQKAACLFWQVQKSKNPQVMAKKKPKPAWKT